MLWQWRTVCTNSTTPCTCREGPRPHQRARGRAAVQHQWARPAQLDSALAYPDSSKNTDESTPSVFFKDYG